LLRVPARPGKIIEGLSAQLLALENLYLVANGREDKAVDSITALLALGARFRQESWSQRGAVAGAGLIAGESLVGVAAALLTSLGLL